MHCHTEHEKFMCRCFDLALQGQGQVAPNPMVGSVLVHNNSIIGEGFHQAFGKAHAEPNAINSLSKQELLQNSTLYVNLEPCSHFGKTPPCVNLIINKKIPKVVIGTPDPNKLVAGKGISLLKEKGTEVLVGVKESECRDLNKRFFTWHLCKRPYIILKWARSADGFIDLERPAGTPIGPNWITSPIARTLVHKWRSEEQAIMAGTNTVLKDNPRLNVREWSGKDPLRVIIDRKLKLGNHYHVFDKSQETLVFTGKQTSTETEKVSEPFAATVNHANTVKTRYATINFDDDPELQMLEILYRNNIQSLIIEGGAYTLTRFIEKGLWDEARIFTGTTLFKEGIRSPRITGKYLQETMIGNSLLQVIYRILPPLE